MLFSVLLLAAVALFVGHVECLQMRNLAAQGLRSAGTRWTAQARHLQPALQVGGVSSSSSFALHASPRGGGSTKIDTRIKSDTKSKSTFREEIEKDWRLILHDDTVHTIQQVVEIVGACCPLCSGAKAYEVTLEVHMSGAGTVAVSNKKVIAEYCKSLQMAGLSVSMAPDDDFEAGEGEEEE